MTTPTSINRLVRRRQKPIVRTKPLSPAEPVVDHLHSLIGKVARVRGIRPGRHMYMAGVLDVPDEEQDITGRINGVRSEGPGLVAVGFVVGGFHTYRTESVQVFAAPPAADRVVELTNPAFGMFR